MARSRGSGFGAYLLPLVSFLLILEAKGRVPESVTGVFLFLQVIVPAGLFLFYAVRGEYAELRGYRLDRMALADVGIGVLGAVIWMAPFIAIDSIRPEDEGAFDPQVLGAEWVGVVLVVRTIGYGVVTPWVEEIFMRGWLLRYAEIVMPESVRWKHDDDGRRRLDFRFGKRGDFRKVPIAHFTWPSFVVVMLFFLGSHVPWEWPVMFVWVLGSQLWFYYRKHLVAVVVLHAATNLSILFAVVALNDRFRDAAGQPISLWFFI